MEEGWATVVKRKRKTNGPQNSVPAKPKSQVIKLHNPRSSAVVITLLPGAAEKGITYAETISEARKRVDLSELGIPSVQFRRAATGGRILEVPGGTSGEKADSLAEKLKEIFSQDDVRVSRPMKCTELRITGLDDSVTKEEVIAAIVRVGECKSDHVKANEIRCNLAGVGTIFVRCPTVAAKKVTSNGRLLVGWVSAQVKLLTPRALRCFRCLEEGHVREQCKADTDRSSQCYRCGLLGHKARECSAEPHCTICATANKPAGHRIGSKACTLLQKKNEKKVTAKAKNQLQPTPPITREVEVRMDTQ